MKNRIEELRDGTFAELKEDILPFWADRMRDTGRGGFFGRIRGDGTADPAAAKGAILNARILWTFSSAYRVFGEPRYLETATAARNEIIGKFYDREFGGVFWSLNPDGSSADGRKQIYALAFALYGLAEYHRATSDREALDYAVRLFREIEVHSRDRENNGYYEAYSRDWGPIEDMRLSEKDRNDCKSMNTHLHILEAYTSLYRVWKSPELEERLRSLLFIFTNKILDARTWHLGLFFNEVWDRTDTTVSYGHDIESSWLLWEAATVLGDENVKRGLRPVVLKIAEAAMEGYVRGCGMMYESDTVDARLDADRHWWVQAETVVGCLNAWQLSGGTFPEPSSDPAPVCGSKSGSSAGSTPARNSEAGSSSGPAHDSRSRSGLVGDTPEGLHFLDTALDCWDFIQKHIIDREKGEWFWSLRADGSPNTDEDKAGFWKCPYHNGRMCMEVAERLSELL